jgi:hypothetical protein
LNIKSVIAGAAARDDLAFAEMLRAVDTHLAQFFNTH